MTRQALLRLRALVRAAHGFPGWSVPVDADTRLYGPQARAHGLVIVQASPASLAFAPQREMAGWPHAGDRRWWPVDRAALFHGADVVLEKIGRQTRARYGA